MPYVVDINDITVFGEASGIATIPEEVFFEERGNGNLVVNTLPLPREVSGWSDALFLGESIYFARNSDKIYIIADTTVFGFCMFTLVSDSDDSHFKVASERGNRIINSERGKQIMSNTSPLANFANRFNNGGVNPINLSAETSAPMMAPAAREGISSGVDPKRLHTEIMSRGHVDAFIMGNAPAVAFGLTTAKTSDGNTEKKIVLRESKPSRVLGVAISLPANCVQRARSLARPDDITTAQVEYDENDKTTMINQIFPLAAAISYISACGGKLPENAITTLDKKSHWTPTEVLSGAPEVSYVYVKPTERKHTTSNQERFTFSLKSTSPRRSLYTPGNIVCLRALEHTSVTCKDEKRAYELNAIAFGSWAYSTIKDEKISKLQKAYNSCPTLIWRKKYNIDGEELEGIGSAFFMAGDTTKSESGQEIAEQQLTYRAWYQTGNRNQEKPEVARQIVLRTLQPATDSKKESMVTKPVTFEKDPNHVAFKPYQKCMDYLIARGFTTRERLAKMGGRTSKAKQKVFGVLSDAQALAMKSFIQQDATDAAIQSVCEEFINSSMARENA